MENFAILEFFLLSSYLIYVIESHAARDVSFLSKFVTFISWLMSIGMIVLVPWDLYITRRDILEGKTLEKDPDFTMLQNLYVIFYWTVFIFSWTLIPILQGIDDAVNFKFRDKLKSSLLLNGLFYILIILGALAFIGLVTYLKLPGDHGLITFLRSLANCWGIFLLVVLLGHTLVSLPMSHWRTTNLELQMKYLQFQVGQKADEQAESLDDLIKQIADTIQIKEYAEKHYVDPEVIAYCNVAQNFVPSQFLEQAKEDLKLVRDQKAFELQQQMEEGEGTQNQKSEENLETQEIKKKNTDSESNYSGEKKRDKKEKYKVSDGLNAFYYTKYAYLAALRSRAALKKVLKQAFMMEDIIANSNNPNKRIESNLRTYKPGFTHQLKARLQWEWLVIYKKFIKIFFAIALGILSVIILLSETTMYFNSEFSIIGNTLRWFLQKNPSSLQIQIVCLIPLSYMAFAVFYGMFRVKIWKVYGIYPNKSTDSCSLLWSAINFSRVSAPLCCNFLSMVGVKESAFKSVIGNIDKVPIFGSSFTSIFPLLIIILAFFNYFDWITRFMNFLGFYDFQFTTGFNHDYIDQGKDILAIKRHQEVQLMQNQEIDMGKVSILMSLIDVREKL